MRIDRLILAAALLAVLPVVAQQMPAPTFETDMKDPWVPPATRAKAAAKPLVAPRHEGRHRRVLRERPCELTD